MVQWDKSCADCSWDAVCTHKKILWNGKEYVYLTACCRSIDGRTYIPSSFPNEPLDWFLWGTIIPRKLQVYGRSQFIPADGPLLELSDSHSRSTAYRASKVLSSAMAPKERDPVAKPLVGLKSVYNNSEDTQGSLF